MQAHPRSYKVRTSPFAELHWYEASGIGRKEIKIKRIIFSL